MVDRVESTYLTFRGTTYLLPDFEYRNGGALALWGEDVLVLHSKGRIYRLDEDRGLIRTAVEAPENNFEAYLELAATEYPDQDPKQDAIRYNDLEFIDAPVFRGFLLSYTYIDVENRCYRTRVDKLAIPDSVVSIKDLKASGNDWERLYESEPCLEFNKKGELMLAYMAGGRVAFKAPNLVYLGNGEFHLDGIYRPDVGIQSDDSDYGKTIEINLETGASRHFSKGHRNLQGITIDTEGRLWTTEHGMRGGDELNLIKDQENYGWPLENLGTLYSGIPAPTIGRVGRHEVFAAPVYAWLPSAAVSCLATVENFHETWDGDLLICSLKNRTLYRARIRGERVVFIEPIPIGQRIRDVMQVGPDKLALWLDTEEVVILQIEERKDRLEGLAEGLVAEGMDAALAEAAMDTLTSCNECHSYEKDIHGAGPSLYGVAGRDIASTAFSDYSAALLGRSETWDRDTLTSFLADPEAFAPGTTMAGLGVANRNAAEAVAIAFEWLRDHAED